MLDMVSIELAMLAVIRLRVNVPIRSLGRNLHRNWYDLLEVLIVSRLCSLQIVQHGRGESREMKNYYVCILSSRKHKEERKKNVFIKWTLLTNSGDRQETTRTLPREIEFEYRKKTLLHRVSRQLRFESATGPFDKGEKKRQMRTNA